ncbi:hypothetical protein BDR03DRAFT_947001 [Suillus americanus]|nr:hypothetical protein BDR03DRAFT_947001 [Suillus americanus]
MLVIHVMQISGGIHSLRPVRGWPYGIYPTSDVHHLDTYHCMGGPCFHELRRYLTRGTIGDCFTVLMKTHMNYFVSFFGFILLLDFSNALSGVPICHLPLHATMIHHFYRTYIPWRLRFILVSLKYSSSCCCLCWGFHGYHKIPIYFSWNFLKRHSSR